MLHLVWGFWLIQWVCQKVGDFFQPKQSSFYWGLALPWRMVDSRLGLGWRFLLYLEKFPSIYYLRECFCLFQMFKECIRMMCFSSICCYDHSFQTVHVSDVWRILYGDYLSANIQDVGRHPHSLSLKRKLQTGVVMAIPLQGLQISWLWKEQQKTSSWHMWLKLYFASSRDNQAHQICPNQGLNMLLSAKVDQPLLSHRAGSRPSTPSMVSVPWNKKGNLLSQNDVVKKQGISIKIIPQFGGGESNLMQMANY